MKKILLAVMAVAAIGFTACGNKAQQGEATDSTAVEVNVADEEADAAIAALTSNLETKDASKFQQALDAVKAKIAELIKTNPEVAKQYVARVQTFLKENADKVKAVVGENAAVAAAVSAITDVEPDKVVSGLLEQVGDAATEAKDAAVDAANQKVDEAKQAATDKANEVKDAAKEKAAGAIDNAANAAKKGLGL
ncbi:MAG: hypothetical protein J6I37_06910 [Prevotella sp.]|nr:hypothetical protein [Prevotella sp.]